MCIKYFYFESLVAKDFCRTCCQAPRCLGPPVEENQLVIKKELLQQLSLTSVKKKKKKKEICEQKSKSTPIQIKNLKEIGLNYAVLYIFLHRIQ